MESDACFRLSKSREHATDFKLLQPSQKLQYLCIELFCIRLMRHMPGAKGFTDRAGHCVDQFRKRRWGKCLIMAAPNHQCRKRNGRQIFSLVVKNTGDVVHTRRGAFVIECGLLTNMHGQRVECACARFHRPAGGVNERAEHPLGGSAGDPASQIPIAI